MPGDLQMIHVRFFNDGSVSEISARPAGVSAQAWFDRLTTRFATRYQSLSGGRGLFRIEAEDLHALATAE